MEDFGKYSNYDNTPFDMGPEKPAKTRSVRHRELRDLLMAELVSALYDADLDDIEIIIKSARQMKQQRKKEFNPDKKFMTTQGSGSRYKSNDPYILGDFADGSLMPDTVKKLEQYKKQFLLSRGNVTSGKILENNPNLPQAYPNSSASDDHRYGYISPELAKKLEEAYYSRKYEKESKDAIKRNLENIKTQLGL